MKSITSEQRQALVQSLRADPPDPAKPGRAFRRAARAAGVDHRTARQHWERGGAGAEPISAIVAREQVQGRYVAAKEELRLRFLSTAAEALDDAGKSRAAEGLAARAVVDGAGQLATRLNALAVTIDNFLVEAVREARGVPAPDKSAPAAERMAFAAERLAFSQKFVSLHKQVAEVLAAGQAADRKALGEVDLLVGVQPVAAGPPPTDAELAAEMEAAGRAVARLKSAGGDDGHGNGVH